MAKTPIAAALVACLVVTASCGGDASNADRFEDDEQAVARVIDDLGAAARDGDAERICDDLVTVDLRRNVGQATGASCADAFSENVVGDETRYVVDDVVVDGSQAT